MGALLAGAVGPDTYWIVAAVYVALAAGATVAPLPPHEAGAAIRRRAWRTRRRWRPARRPGAIPSRRATRPSGGRFSLLRTPAIAVAVGLVTLCFFGDGAIEGYAALFLRDVLESGSLLTGVALAAFHRPR